MRATSFLFGILAGYLVHYIKEHKIHFSPIQQSFLWISALVIGFASMFSIVLFFGVEYSPISRALYAALHRLGWSYATSWVLLACILGYAGPIRTVLASPALVPLSRLTYCAYLTNGLVELFQAASIRSPKYMSVMNLFGETISHIVITFLGAMVLCLIFESPIHGIEKIFLRKGNAFFEFNLIKIVQFIVKICKHRFQQAGTPIGQQSQPDDLLGYVNLFVISFPS